MKIGVVSDTHDNLFKIKEMVEILNLHRVKFVLHAGDFVAPFSLSPLEELHCEWKGVFGNNDGEKEGLIRRSGGRIKEKPLFLEMDSRRIVLTHEFKDYPADVLIFGHTHSVEVRQDDKKLILNPGEVCGWLTGKSSLAILDLKKLKPEVIYF